MMSADKAIFSEPKRVPDRGVRVCPRGRRGAIFVTALGVIVVLTGLVLVFSQEMRTETLAAKNRTSAVQAGLIEQGGENWVLAQIEAATVGDAVGITQIPAEQMQVGDGYFWVLRPDPTSDQNYAFGITDESAKVNITSAASATMLLLPNVTPEIADSIVDWRDPNSNALPNGAETDYYQQYHYDAKNSPFETVEELLLVRGMSKQVLFGYDLNRDGVIDDAERSVAGAATAFNSVGSDSRGLFNFVTVYSVEPNTDAAGKARINVNAAGNDPKTKAALQKFLEGKLTKSEATTIMAKMAELAKTPGRGSRFLSVIDFLVKANVSKTSYAKIMDGLTVSRRGSRPGLINVATAPRQVLLTLGGGIDEGDADSLFSKREGADTSNLAWVMTAIPILKAQAIGNEITSRSFQYSADIVGVSGDGRSFRRARIVVDATKLPAKIVYRKDLTSYGWPLDPAIRDILRSGVTLGTGSNGGFNLSR